MKVFREAGLPDGVVNFIPGQGSVIGKIIVSNAKHLVRSAKPTDTFKEQDARNAALLPSLLIMLVS